MKFRNICILVITIIFIYIYVNNVEKFVPIEDLDIVVGIGNDLVSKDSKDSKELVYSVPLSVYNFEKGETSIDTIIMEGRGTTIGETREDRQRKASKKFILGTQKIILFSDDVAESSIEEIVNILFTNPLVSDIGKVAVIKGKTVDVLSMKIEGYKSSSDYINGLIENAYNYNFFSENYKIKDVFTRMDAEGRNITLPYITANDGKLKIVGVAIFNKDKMVEFINLEDSKSMNILRENKVHGSITLKDSNGESTDLYLNSNRKVKCEKKDEKYIFNINLNVKCNIINNNIYKELLDSPLQAKELEKNAEKEIEKMCNDFIEKMQKNIKIDCLELGRIASAKYGRRSGVDWNKVITESDINVKAKVDLDKLGRGKY